MVMAWNEFQRLYRNHKRKVGIVITSTTIAVGLAAVMYDKLKRKRAAVTPSLTTSTTSLSSVSDQATRKWGMENNVNEASSSLPRSVSSKPHRGVSERECRQCNCNSKCRKGSDCKPTVEWNRNWDMRDPRSLVPPPETKEEEAEYREKLKSMRPKATRHLILIRHGIYVHKDIPDSQQILTELGREQAEMTGKHLQNLKLNYTKMISSTLTRAIETSDIIHQHLPTLSLERDELLCEGRPIEPEPFLHWRPPYVYYQQGAQIEAAFRKYFHRASPEQKEDSIDILVCHANVIRYFVCRALQFPPEGWLRLALTHGSITHIMIRPSGHVYLHSLGSSSHMTPGKVTISTRGQILW